MVTTVRKRRIRFNYRWQLVSPALIILVLINAVPMLHALYTSLQFYYLSRPQDRHFIGLDNYLAVLTDSRTLDSLQITLVFSSAAVLLELILGVALAYLLLRIPRFQSAYLAVLMIPMLMNQVAVGLIWRLLLHPDLGIVNYLLRTLGMSAPNWLGRSPNALITLILVDAWQWTPFMMLLLYAGLLSLPQEPFEAARIDGASGWQTFFYLTIPLLMPVIIVALIIRVMDALKTYSLVYILTEGGPGTTTEVLSFHIYKIGFIYSDMGRAAALAFLLSALIMFITIVFLQVTRRSDAGA